MRCSTRIRGYLLANTVQNNVIINVKVPYLFRELNVVDRMPNALRQRPSARLETDGSLKMKHETRTGRGPKALNVTILGPGTTTGCTRAAGQKNTRILTRTASSASSVPQQGLGPPVFMLDQTRPVSLRVLRPVHQARHDVQPAALELTNHRSRLHVTLF